MELLQIIFMPTDLAPMTDEDVKVFLGIWIFLNFLWVVSWVITGIRYFFFKRNGGTLGFERPHLLEWVFDLMMVLIWAGILLIIVGKWIANFL